MTSTKSSGSCTPPLSTLRGEYGKAGRGIFSPFRGEYGKAGRGIFSPLRGEYGKAGRGIFSPLRGEYGEAGRGVLAYRAESARPLRHFVTPPPPGEEKSDMCRPAGS